MLLIIGLVGLGAFVLISLSRPPSPKISLGIVNYTNASAVVVATNLSPLPLRYFLKIEHKTGSDWPTYKDGLPVGESGANGMLAPGEGTRLSMPVMVYAPACPWRVSIFCLQNPPGPASIRVKASLWLLKLRQPKLAQKILGIDKPVQVSSPQMEQWEK